MHASVDGAMVVDGVTRIELPRCDWGPTTAIPSRRDGDGGTVAPYFVAGRENRLAMPALERLFAGEEISSVAQLFNPLVLLGGSGSGKSMLARGIARRWHSLLGESAVAYFTAADFGRELHSARADGALDTFRRRLAEVDMLVIEDLQRLAPRVFVQRELRDLIDELIGAGRVVVITSQQSPATIARLEVGLRDRLTAGLIVRLNPPGIEARQAILERAAAERRIELTPEQLHNLAQRVNGPAPQLLRALAETDLSTSRSAPAADPRGPTLKQIVAVVARYFSLTQAVLRSAARRKSLVHARGVAIYLARGLTDLSYAQIGQALGRRDHSTIMHAYHTTETLVSTDTATQQAIDQLRRILTAV